MAKGFKVFIIILVFVIVLLAGAVALYQLELIPGLNEKVHSFLGLKIVQEEKLQEIQQEEILKEQTSIKGLFPHLIPVSQEQVANARKLAQELPFSVYSKTNLYTIDFFDADLEKKSIATDGDSESSMVPVIQTKLEPLNSYKNSYPVVAHSADFYDTTVFIDAEPALVCLDKETATEILRIPCQVYPQDTGVTGGQDAPFTYLQSYYFKSKTGNWYEVRFEKGSIAPESLSIAKEVTKESNFEQEIYNSLLPGKVALDFIDAKMNGLLSVTPAVKVTESLLYAPEREALSFPQSVVSPAFVFSPKEQGNYTLGLCDADGAWIRDNAFVVLYTMAGEALAISLDYVADRPQITTHLSDQELYIACVGFFPDSLILDAGPTDDFREGGNALNEDSTLVLDDELEETNPEDNSSLTETYIDGIPMDVIVLEAPETTEKITETGEEGDSPLGQEELEQDTPVQPVAYFQVKKAP